MEQPPAVADLARAIHEYRDVKLGLTPHTPGYETFTNELWANLYTLLDVDLSGTKAKMKHVNDCLAAHATGWGAKHGGCLAWTRKQKRAAKYLAGLPHGQDFRGAVFGALRKYDKAWMTILSALTIASTLAARYGIKRSELITRFTPGAPFSASDVKANLRAALQWVVAEVNQQTPSEQDKAEIAALQNIAESNTKLSKAVEALSAAVVVSLATSVWLHAHFTITVMRTAQGSLGSGGQHA